jgi:hypothetical protein
MRFIKGKCWKDAKIGWWFESQDWKDQAW